MDSEIEFRKECNELIRKSRENSKLDYCLSCGKKVSSFCKSHSLPKFVLNSISKNGMVYTANKFFGIPIMDKDAGIKTSGLFKRICIDCDNQLFKNYEEEKQLLQRPTKKIMAQIDLKNNLRLYDKRLNEIELYKLLVERTTNETHLSFLMYKQRINFLDLNEIKIEFDRDIKILKKESTSSFELIYWNVLNYVTPIAFQGHIALYGDLKGNIINDIYSECEKYVIEYLNICIFPLKEKTIVIMFVNKKNKKYRDFIKQFKNLSETKKHQLISFILFNYSEDYFVSQSAKEEIVDNPILKETSHHMTDIIALNEEVGIKMKKEKLQELKKYTKFPNILDEIHAIVE